MSDVQSHGQSPRPREGTETSIDRDANLLQVVDTPDPDKEPLLTVMNIPRSGRSEKSRTSPVDVRVHVGCAPDVGAGVYP